MLTLQVTAHMDEARGVAGLVLADPHGLDLPEWVPGAHIDVHIDRPGAPPLVRQYSLCGDPGDRTVYRIAVLREDAGEGGSIHVHDHVRQGQLVRVSEPRDRFGFAPRERMVFVAGGIGITPILPMLRAAEAAGSEWTLHYAGREPSTMAFGADLEIYGDRVRIYVSSEGQRMGLTDVLARARACDAVVYACGPARLLDALENEADAAGVEVHLERFVNSSELTVQTDHAFEVELSLTGKTFTVQPGETILDKVVEAGVPAPSSCRGGTCGTCETFIVEGAADHRDAVLNARERAENEVMMICVSRCTGKRLVLEL
ncbi:PDR/VanB family oxidoreductase [Microbacterium cremeum]|uniref:PDR/VanB family oxidoreductase n=1 Tax=Microbacterium cremeum TaxID=2782169 RepID=UPI001886F583|nr:PDR/VanB family oxidoreductase [Microbacterium cremeum]